MMFGRGPVNFVLRSAYFVWFSPYVALIALAALAVFPHLYPAIALKMRELIVSAVAVL